MAGGKDSHDFRPEARVRNVNEGRNDRKGYIGESKATSMFAEPNGQDDDGPTDASMEEFAICLVSMFDDVRSAFEAFDSNRNGALAMAEFTAGVQRLGFTVRDSKNIFRELKGSLASAITRSEFSSLWQMGGGTVTPTKARSVSPVGQRSGAPPPETVQSFGAFLDGDPRMDTFSIHDLEEPLLVFARWAQGRWHILFSLFGYQDSKGVISGRQKVRASDFVNFVRGQGFEGNAVRVFAEIQKEGPHLDRTKTGEDAQADEGLAERDDITMAQLVHFQQRAKALVETMRVGDEGSPASRLIKLLKEKRQGCLLRAWRLDLDVRGSGRVAYSDFVVALRNLGIPSEAKQIWSCFRPDGPSISAPLELADLDGEEAANVEHFAECLWSNFGFDLDNAWAAIDTCSRKLVTLDEWVQGTKNLGFEGNAKVIFQGLGNLGKLWRKDFEYMNVLSKSSMRAQHSAMPIKSLQSWVQSQFEGAGTVEKVNALLNALGFPEEVPPKPPARKDQKLEEVKLSVSDLSARLTALGYPHDALQASMIAARTGRGANITRESLYTLLIGKRAGAPPRRHSRLLRAASAGQLEKNRNSGKAWRPRKVWKDSVDNISLINDQKPASVRNYFSVPSSKSGFSIADRLARDPERSPSPKQPPSRSVSPIQAKVDSNLSGSVRGSSSARAQSASPPRSQRQNTSDQGSSVRRPRASIPDSLKDRPGWDNSLHASSEVNNRISKYVREYFEERERPAREEIHKRRELRKNQKTQQTLGIAPMSNGPPSVGSPRFGAPVAGTQAALQLAASRNQSAPSV